METITLKLKDSVGSRGIEMNVTRFTLAGEDPYIQLSAEYEKLVAVLDEKKLAIAVQETTRTEALDDAQSVSAPVCPECGAGTKISKSGKRWVCTKAKFRLVNDEWTNSGCDGYVER